MGYGDFKLFAAFGAWFGWRMLLPIILFASLVGSVVGIYIMYRQRKGMRHADCLWPLPCGRGLAVPAHRPPDRRPVSRAVRASRLSATMRGGFRIGLTGGIASGKSTVANLFAALGVPDCRYRSAGA